MEQIPTSTPHRTENADSDGPRSPSAAAASSETKEKPVDVDRTEESSGSDDVDRVQPVDHGILSEVDEFIGVLSEMRGKDEVVSNVPKSVELLPEAVQSMMEKYSTAESGSKFGENNDADSPFFDSVDRLSKLTDMFEDLSSSPTISTSVNKVSAVLQRSMSFLEDEFRAVLETSIGGGTVAEEEPNHLASNKSFMTKYTSFSSQHDSSTTNEPESKQSLRNEFPGFSDEDVAKMHRIAKSMISSGYQNECGIVYNFLRRNAIKSALADLGFEIVSIDDLQKMQWDSLEGEITSWIKIVKECSNNLLPNEQKLCSSIFPDHHPSLFGDLMRSICFRLVNFAEAVLLTKQSVEKLFKMLDMYESVRDLIESIPGPMEDLRTELTKLKNRLAEAALNMFDDLENSIRNDSGRIPVPSGAVHPLTRYTMNYLIYACDQYKDTLRQVFQIGSHRPNSDRTLVGQFTTVMELLDSNLDMKSTLYKDPSLRYIFLMNNGRYILQKIKGSPEIRELMGDTWYRKRSSDLRGYHKSYQRETWYRLLQCLSHEKLQVSGKVSKPVLKERFKSFNTMFEDIHKTQSTWVVSDEQLQSELRVSIAAVVTPAYRSFLGRFNQYLDPGRQTEKYVKYQPEDIETLIEDLFAGNPSSMARRRT